MYSITKNTNFGKLSFKTLAKKELGKDFRISNEFIVKQLKSNEICSPLSLFFLKQIHSCHFYSTEEMVNKNCGVLEGDAIFSKRYGDFLLVKTADCLPIILYSTTHLFYAMIHAGWRGLIGGLTEKVIQKATQKGISSLKILIGPYAARNYEVEQDVASLFDKKCPKSVKQINKNKYEINFVLFLSYSIQQNGWNIPIENSTISTLDENEFFSHRRGNIERNLNILTIIK